MQSQSHKGGYPTFPKRQFRSPNMPLQKLSGGGVGQYQQYNPDNYGPDFPPASLENDPLYPNDLNPSATPTPGIPIQNNDPNVQINPTGNYGNTPGGLELVNGLGYDPSAPYGASGSGVPTQKLGGLGGSLAGAALGSLLFPGVGTMLGGKLGAIGGRMLTRWLQQQHQGGGSGGSGGTAGVGPLENVTGNPPTGGGDFNPFGGLPEGFTESNRFGGGAPNFSGPGSFGPQWQGGSIFASHGGPSSLITPGGQSAISGAPGGMLGDFGAKLALHSTNFLKGIQGMGYKNLNQFQNSTGFSLNTPQGGGQGIGGGQLPMKQNYAGGGVAKPDDLVNRAIPNDTLDLQGIDRNTMTPEEMADRYLALMAENEERRREAMNEKDQSHHMAMSFAGGGKVPPVQPQEQLRGMGTDTVNAALTPGELVLNKQQESAVMPRPGMKHKLRPDQLAVLAIALRKRQGHRQYP